jgi:two-component system sensor histidine kinase BarA
LPLDAIDADAPAVIRRAGAVGAGIVVAVPGEATRDSLTLRLAEAGFAPLGAAADEASTAHWIAEAGVILDIGYRPTGSGRVLALARAGDAAGASIIAAGWADHLLTWPVVQDEWRHALAALAADAPFDADRRAVPAARTQLPQFSMARILVADDSAVNREVAREALARCGVTGVIMVEDGRMAMEACRRQTFDLVLMDGSMPVLDGYAAAEGIRADAIARGQAQTPIVALTAHVVGAGADAWREAGMNGKLNKPFTLAALAETLSSFLVPDVKIEGEPSVFATEADGSTLLDEDVLEGLIEMAEHAGGDFSGRLLRMYRDQAPTALDDLCLAAEAADADAVARTAHSLKSMSLNIGGQALAQVLSTMELAARSDAVLPTGPEIAQLKPLLYRTMAAIDARLDPNLSKNEVGMF